MPIERVKSDISHGALVRIVAEDAPAKGFAMPMSAVYRTDKPPGPAGRWLVERLQQRSLEVGADLMISPKRVAKSRRRSARAA
jgi:DNA-binding transcriptional LysR family regulator